MDHKPPPPSNKELHGQDSADLLPELKLPTPKRGLRAKPIHPLSPNCLNPS